MNYIIKLMGTIQKQKKKESSMTVKLIDVLESNNKILKKALSDGMTVYLSQADVTIEVLKVRWES